MSRSSNPTLSGFKVRVIRPSASPIDHDLEEGRSIFIGRSDSCGIQIKGDGVADIHCLIDVEDGVVSIQDWASDAGTKVNGQAIDDKHTLQAGDSIAIGSIKVELAGQPGKTSHSKPSPSESTGPPREESIGMEHLGYEEDAGGATAVADPTPDVQPSADRLSDTLAGHEDDAPTTHLSLEEEPLAPSSSDCEAEDDAEPLDLLAERETILDEEEVEADFAANHFTDDDLDWDPNSFQDEQVDAEIVSLLKSEIEDLRIQLAERDEQLAAMGGLHHDDPAQDESALPGNGENEFGGGDLVARVDELLAELADHDERESTLQELLQTAEVQNQAEREERNCLENWVGEIEQRIGERESEWQAEQDSLRDRLEAANEQRDQLQQQLHAAAKRLGKTAGGEVAPDETLSKLQQQNADLQNALDESQKQCANLTRQIERLQTEEPESLQELRAELAQEKASVSRMRFQLSKQLQEIGSAPQPKDQPDREFALKLQTLREHLREIHEEEKTERDQRGESLFGRISNLWKRVDDEY